MTKSSLIVLLSCLGFIGLLAMKNGSFLTSPLPTFVTDAVSADSLPVFSEPGRDEASVLADLNAGELLFETQCTLCHSAPLVFKSKVLAGEIDSLVVKMLDKDHIEL